MSAISAKQRAEMEADLRRDYPSINSWMLQTVLDLYCSEGGKAALDAVVKNHARAASRGKGYVIRKDPMPSDFDGGSVRQWTEEDDARSQAFLASVNARVLEKSHDSSEQTSTTVTEI